MSKVVLRSVALAVAAVILAVAPAQAALPADPLFVFDSYEPEPKKPPVFPFEGPCGLAVDATGDLYVSNYYPNAVEIYDPALIPGKPQGRIPNVDPLDGPCGLAVAAPGSVLVNNYHRNVEQYTLAGSVGIIDSFHPTGVALDPGGTVLYVNQRSQVAVYDTPTPGTIGASTIVDAYGLAVSGHPATFGYVYVPDAATDTVKVFDPATDPETPIMEIDGSELPGGGFGSLRDSAIAVDNSTGTIYVADTQGEQLTEQPKATIHAFAPSGAYLGRLKHDVIDASPVGLAVDNSPAASQGRVYVTSGNGDKAAIYAYPSGAPGFPPVTLAAMLGGGEGSAQVAAAPTSLPAPDSTPSSPRRGEAAASAIAQKGNLRVAVNGRLAPKRLPRAGAAPISVTVGGRVSTTDQSRPPQLQALRIEINRNGRLDATGLPVCSQGAIQPASTQRALAACRAALVGQGSFEAEITLAGQGAYPTKGKLLLFNGRKGGKPVLLGQIYAPRPFATSFVIVFEIVKRGRGAFGTTLEARLPQALGSWGNLIGIEMTLQRRYAFQGKARSFVSAGCPAPKGFSGASFSLARTTFGFAGGERLTSVLGGSCQVRG